MALNPDEEAWVEGLMSSYNEDRGKVSEWERGFMDDQVKRWDEFAAETRFSAKQWAILDRVAEKLGYVGRDFS